jgi:DNA-binding LytR/AlgR family response regulator
MLPFGSPRIEITFRIVATVLAAVVASHVVLYQRFPWQRDYHFPRASFFIVAAITTLVWQANLFVFKYLDLSLPFRQNPFRRIITQVVLGGVATFIVFVFGYFSITEGLYGGNISITGFTTGLVICLTIATIINGIYLSGYLLITIDVEKQANETSASTPPNTVVLMPTLLIESVQQQFQIRSEEVAYFYSTNGIVLLKKSNNESITTRYTSLAEVEPKLETTLFFQLNRQFIVHRQAIRSVKNEANQKLLVEILPSLTRDRSVEPVTVSRYRSASFKKWLSQ